MRPVIFAAIAAAAHFVILSSTCRAEEQSTEFTKALRDVRQGVFLVGGPKVGTGTAWVISKKHRLLATNAHVADMFFEAPPGKFLAMMNGSDQTYVVKQVWYHPGTDRFVSKDENLFVRSMDPKLGTIMPRCPDVAVLQLSPEGPDLPVELKFAPTKVLYDLQAMPSAMLGYPGHDTKVWPQPGHKAQATFAVGVISRVTDFGLEGGVRDELTQLLQYSMENWFGYSGSPVFLASGEVIGLNNMMRPADPTKRESRQIGHGIRVDVLWELLAHHQLTDKVAIPVAADKLHLKRYSEPDPNLELHRRLKKLNDEAIFLIYTKLDFAAGIAKCDEAIKLYPRFAPAFRTRSDGFNNWYVQAGKNWTMDKRLQFLSNALSDATRNFQLHGQPTTDAFQTRLAVLNNLGNATKDKKFNQQVLEGAEDVLNIANLSNLDRARALSIKACSLDHLGLKEKARVAHLQAVQTNPDAPIIWENRANFFASIDAGQAKFDNTVAKNLRKKYELMTEQGLGDYKVTFTLDGQLTAQDTVDPRGCFRKVVEVELEAGYYYQIDLKNPAFRSDKDYDPILKLADDKGTVLMEDDDGGAYPNARIFFTPNRTATFRLAATSYLKGQTGPFMLTVLRIAKHAAQNRLPP